MKRVWVVAALLALVGCAGPIERTADFADADRNGDGNVSLPEFLNFGGSEAAFMAVDVKRTGFLTEAQFREALRYSDRDGAASQRQQVNMDQQLANDINAALGASPDLYPGAVTASAFQGNVTLSGAVRTQKEKQLAESIAQRIARSRAVFNQIVIRQ